MGRVRKGGGKNVTFQHPSNRSHSSPLPSSPYSVDQSLPKFHPNFPLASIWDVSRGFVQVIKKMKVRRWKKKVILGVLHRPTKSGEETS